VIQNIVESHPPDSLDSICFFSCVQKSAPFAIVVAMLESVVAHNFFIIIRNLRFEPQAGRDDVAELEFSDVGG